MFWLQYERRPRDGGDMQAPKAGKYNALSSNGSGRHGISLAAYAASARNKSRAIAAFEPMTASPTTFPREHIPKNAVLSLRSVSMRPRARWPSILDVGRPKFVTSGTMATGLCLWHAGIGEGDSVLLPAYHCVTMVTPVVWRGATPIFYRIHDDTSVDLDDVASKLDSSCRVLVAPHYFGFPQDAARIRAFCKGNRLVYLEDCAHAFFGSSGGQPLGSFGDYAIASPWKFFPITEGGIVTSAERDLSALQLRRPGLHAEGKALFNAMEYAFEYDRLHALKILCSVPLRLKAAAWRRRARASGFSAGADASASGDMQQFDSGSMTKAMSIPSRLTIRYCDMERMAARRRRNYRRLACGLSNLSAARPLFKTLTDETVPQVFPLVVDNPEETFPRLRRAGVPIIRFGEQLWPGVDASTCAVSAHLSRCVFQFPCHQDYRDEEVDWMIGTVRDVLGGAC